MTWQLLPNYRPLGLTPGWMAAAERQEGQCGHVGKVQHGRPGRRCERYLNGGEKMYLWTDGALYCKRHFDSLRLEARKAK